MFSYYGSKSKIVDLYPRPKYDRIIEPFAGSARYSLKWFERDVLLVDKYEVIVSVWKYLQQCSIRDIMTLPDVQTGDCLDDFCLTKEQKWLIGFYINNGSSSPKKTAKDFNSWNQKKHVVAANLFKIKHWDIRLGTYDDIPNGDATWFIDPPYQYGGEWYVKSSKTIDFGNLAGWCKGRLGQIIVCENTKADWLPFKPMKEMQGAIYKTTEAIWSNYPTDYDWQQQQLFRA